MSPYLSIEPSEGETYSHPGESGVAPGWFSPSLAGESWDGS